MFLTETYAVRKYAVCIEIARGVSLFQRRSCGHGARVLSGLVGGRVIHTHGLLTEKSSHWVLGMQVTLFTRIGLALADNMCGTIIS